MPSLTSDSITQGIYDAAKTVVDKSIKELSFDKAIICTIESLENKTLNKYLVSDGSVTFTAYATNDYKYKVHDSVYVQILNNDFNTKKFIIGLASEEGTQDIYTEQASEIYHQHILLNASQKLAKNELIVFSSNIVNLDSQNMGLKLMNAETKLAINFSVKTTLGFCGQLKGFYSVHFKITGTDYNNKYIKKTYSIDNSGFVGDTYNYTIPTMQKCICDVSTFSTIQTISAYYTNDSLEPIYKDVNTKYDFLKYIDIHCNSIDTIIPSIIANKLTSLVIEGTLNKDTLDFEGKSHLIVEDDENYNQRYMLDYNSQNIIFNYNVSPSFIKDEIFTIDKIYQFEWHGNIYYRINNFNEVYCMDLDLQNKNYCISLSQDKYKIINPNMPTYLKSYQGNIDLTPKHSKIVWLQHTYNHEANLYKDGWDLLNIPQQKLSSAVINSFPDIPTMHSETSYVDIDVNGNNAINVNNNGQHLVQGSDNYYYDYSKIIESINKSGVPNNASIVRVPTNNLQTHTTDELKKFINDSKDTFDMIRLFNNSIVKGQSILQEKIEIQAILVDTINNSIIEESNILTYDDPVIKQEYLKSLMFMYKISTNFQDNDYYGIYPCFNANSKLNIKKENTDLYKIELLFDGKSISSLPLNVQHSILNCNFTWTIAGKDISEYKNGNSEISIQKITPIKSDKFIGISYYLNNECYTPTLTINCEVSKNDKDSLNIDTIAIPLTFNIDTILNPLNCDNISANFLSKNFINFLDYNNPWVEIEINLAAKTKAMTWDFSCWDNYDSQHGYLIREIKNQQNYFEVFFDNHLMFYFKKETNRLLIKPANTFRMTEIDYNCIPPLILQFWPHEYIKNYSQRFNGLPFVSKSIFLGVPFLLKPFTKADFNNKSKKNAEEQKIYDTPLTWSVVSGVPYALDIVDGDLLSIQNSIPFYNVNTYFLLHPDIEKAYKNFRWCEIMVHRGLTESCQEEATIRQYCTWYADRLKESRKLLQSVAAKCKYDLKAFDFISDKDLANEAMSYETITLKGLQQFYIIDGKINLSQQVQQPLQLSFNKNNSKDTEEDMDFLFNVNYNIDPELDIYPLAYQFNYDPLSKSAAGQTFVNTVPYVQVSNQVVRFQDESTKLQDAARFYNIVILSGDKQKNYMTFPIIFVPVNKEVLNIENKQMLNIPNRTLRTIPYVAIKTDTQILPSFNYDAIHDINIGQKIISQNQDILQKTCGLFGYTKDKITTEILANGTANFDNHVSINGPLSTINVGNTLISSDQILVKDKIGNSCNLLPSKLSFNNKYNIEQFTHGLWIGYSTAATEEDLIHDKNKIGIYICTQAFDDFIPKVYIYPNEK